MKTKETKPTPARVYCFINGRTSSEKGADYSAVALAEDGMLLASVVASGPLYARQAVGATDPVTPEGHEHHRTYGKHYPGGYEVEWVEHFDLDKHMGVQEAIRANAEQEARVTVTDAGDGHA